MPHPVTERVQPWLGTLVSIRVEGLPSAKAHAAISAAFTEIEIVHRLMSFHRPESEVSQLNREGSIRPLKIHPRTWRVLRCALSLSEATNGCFDISVGAELALLGRLPKPANHDEPLHGTWRDIELGSGQTVRFRRPLWVDLGGIAKGYAVDCAAEVLALSRPLSAVVNAGGDLRIVGDAEERIALRVDHQSDSRAVPVLTVSNASVASSCTSRAPGVHVNGQNRASVGSGRFVSVVAGECMVADALTKAVLSDPAGSVPTLRSYGAQAYVHDVDAGWSCWQ